MPTGAQPEGTVGGGFDKNNHIHVAKAGVAAEGTGTNTDNQVPVAKSPSSGLPRPAPTVHVTANEPPRKKLRVSMLRLPN